MQDDDQGDQVQGLYRRFSLMLQHQLNCVDQEAEAALDAAAASGRTSPVPNGAANSAATQGERMIVIIDGALVASMICHM